jgi:hypothetical protein
MDLSKSIYLLKLGLFFKKKRMSQPFHIAYHKDESEKIHIPLLFIFLPMLEMLSKTFLFLGKKN